MDMIFTCNTNFSKLYVYFHSSYICKYILETRVRLLGNLKHGMLVAFRNLYSNSSNVGWIGGQNSENVGCLCNL